MRILDIVPGTSVDGPGLRTTVYFAGCRLKCQGCHNPQSWDENGGREMDIDTLAALLIAEDEPVTFSGGDPLLQPDGLIALSRKLREAGLNIWCYTGRVYEDLVADGRFDELFGLMDVLVDGPFVSALKASDLLFRGSFNQRLIDLPKTRLAGSVQLWEPEF